MIDTVFRRDRAVILVGLAGITVLAWAYMFYLIWQMDQMSMEMAMPQMAAWTGLDFALTFVMWSVMMVAMMIPSATPMILTYANINRKRHLERRPFGPTSIFVLGYVAIWVGFSLAATILQWLLHSATLLSPMMVTTSAILGSVLLIAAGLFQFTPLKHRCLQHCRSPISFFLNEWRDGRFGAFRMGLKHGVYCLGCCWILMTLLFVAGVMNLLWVAALAVLVLLEKIMPSGPSIARVTGVIFILWGLWLAGTVIVG